MEANFTKNNCGLKNAIKNLCRKNCVAYIFESFRFLNITNILAYFISGKYQAVYSFCYANEDGNGHITSCIKQNDWFYFIDMMMCRNDSQVYLCQENGVLKDLWNSEWAGFLYKCNNPVDFCRFHINNCQRKNRVWPFCFYIRETEYVFATGLSMRCDGVEFLIPDNEKPTILYLDEASRAKLCITKFPNSLIQL